MAIVEMKKFRLVGLSSEKEKIIGALLRSGSVQLKPTEEIDLTVRGVDGEKLDDAASVYSRACVALDFLKTQKNSAQKRIKRGELPEDILPKEKGGLFSVRDEVSADDFEGIELERQKLMQVCDVLSETAARQNELNTQKTALVNELSGLYDYRTFPLKFTALQSAKSVSFLLGLCKYGKSMEADLKALSEKYGAASEITPIGNPKGKTTAYVFFAAVKNESRQEMEGELAAYSYTPCPYTYDCTAEEKIKELSAKKKEIKAQELDLLQKSLQYLKYVKQLQLLCDNYSFRMDMIRAEGDFAKTEKTFVLESFTPFDCVAEVEKIIKDTTQNVALTFYDVEEKDCPPTLLKNNPVVSPYESITNMYSPPSYYEADPNPFVALFYFIFFGIMLGDAGYGLILAVACFVLTRFVKMEKGVKSVLLVFGMGGISAVVWGLLFGSIFSIDGIKPILFSPMEDPIAMLIFSLLLGLLQIFVGMGFQAHEMIKKGHAADAVYDIFSWYTIFAGAGVAVLPMFVGGMPEIMTKIGLVILIVGVAVLMFGGAIRGKGIFGRIFGAVKPLYGIVNYFSDVMSYSRLFGLCVASSAIGLVFNTLATVLMDLLPPGLGVALAVIILLLGHTLNLAIGLLGIYVHDSRLQFIEFFGRFYHGGGKLFTPLGMKLKYVTIKKQEV